MHNYNCIVTPLLWSPSVTFQIVICSGAWVWLIIIFVIVSCTDLSLYFYTCSAISSNLSPYFLHLFNSVPIEIFLENLYISSFTSFLMSPGLTLHYNCLKLLYHQCCLFRAHIYSHSMMVFLWNRNLCYIAALSTTVRNSQLDATIEQNADLNPEWLWTEDHITCSPRLCQKD